MVAGGEALLSPSVTRRLIGEFAARAKQPPRSAALEELTDREREVIALAAGGLSNEQIEDSARRERVEPLADGSRRLEDLTERDQRVERRGLEFTADVLAECRERLAVPRWPAATRGQRV